MQTTELSSEETTHEEIDLETEQKTGWKEKIRNSIKGFFSRFKKIEWSSLGVPLLWILIGIILLVAAVFLYRMYNQYKKKPSTPTENPSPVHTSNEPAPSSKIDSAYRALEDLKKQRAQEYSEKKLLDSLALESAAIKKQFAVEDPHDQQQTPPVVEIQKKVSAKKEKNVVRHRTWSLREATNQ